MDYNIVTDETEAGGNEEGGDEEEEDEIGGLFKVLKQKSEAQSVDRVAVNSTDCSKCLKNSLIQLEVEKV